MEFGGSSLAGLARIRKGIRSKRSSSFDRTGGGADIWVVRTGETRVLSEMKEPGLSNTSGQLVPLAHI